MSPFHIGVPAPGTRIVHGRDGVTHAAALTEQREAGLASVHAGGTVWVARSLWLPVTQALASSATRHYLPLRRRE